MNDSPIRKFCESPRRGLIAAIVTALLAIATLTPMADEYMEKSKDFAALEEELDRARETASDLPQLEDRTTKLLARLEQIEERCVSEETLSKYRTRLVEIVRDAGCQMRSLNLASPTLRAWNEGDSPLEAAIRGAQGTPTPFSLETRTVNLSVSGGAREIYQFLDKLKDESTLVYPDKLEMQSDGRGGDVVNVNLEMRLFALSRHSP